MADVRLDFYDLDAEELPDLCMKCGAPSTVRPMKNFTWMPYWARFLPPIIGVAFMKRRRVPIPLCEQHKNHWTMRYLVGFGGGGLFFLLLVFGIIVMAATDGRMPGAALGFLLLAGAAITFLVWIIAAIALSVTAISVVEITEDTIVLKNVSYDFTEAYREQTRGGFEPEVERTAREQFGRPGGRRPRDDDEPRKQQRDNNLPDDKYRRG